MMNRKRTIYGVIVDAQVILIVFIMLVTFSSKRSGLLGGLS